MNSTSEWFSFWDIALPLVAVVCIILVGLKMDWILGKISKFLSKR